MANKQMIFGAEAAVQLKRGLEQLASAVKVTMGPPDEMCLCKSPSVAPQ